MTDTKHTPKPWKVAEDITSFSLGPDEVLTIIEARGYGIIGYAIATPADDEELKANADLMASAPTLQSRIDNLVDYIDRLEAEKAELVESCQFFISALETGLLVRDISKDGESDWALKMLDFARELEKAHAALSKHTPESEQGAKQTNPKKE